MAFKDSTLYDRVYVKKYVSDARDRGGRVVPIPFEHTVTSGELGGGSAGTSTQVNLCVLPANCIVVGLELSLENLWASAGVNGTIRIGDAGDDDRYLRPTEAYDAAAGPRATEGDLRGGHLAHTGQNYKVTADTVVYADYRTANPTVGKTYRGCFFVIPGA